MPDYRLGRHRGSFCVVWTDKDGIRRRRSLGTSDKLHAEREFQRALAEIERGKGPKGETVDHIMEAYIADRAAEGKDVERQEYARASLKPTFGHLLPSSITNQLCKDYVKKRQSQGRAASTIHTEMLYLRTAMNMAEKRKWITEHVEIAMPEKSPPRDRQLSRDEADRLTEACELPHLRLFVILALCTAGRTQAILDLTWDRIDMDRRRIALRDPDKAETNKRRAVVPMAKRAYEALKEAQTGAISDYVVEWGGRKVGSIKKGFAAAASRAGMDDVTPHTLRHTAAVWMAESGVPMSEISAYLGHTDSRVTERVYAKYSPDYLQKAAEALDW